MKLKMIALAAAIAFSGSAMAATTLDFDTVDANGDGNLTLDEFYGSASDAGLYSDWDLDNDGLIEENEFDEFGADWDYDTWDASGDGYLDSGEFYDGYYATFDANEDGHWDGLEWDDAGESGIFDW